MTKLEKFLEENNFKKQFDDGFIFYTCSFAGYHGKDFIITFSFNEDGTSIGLDMVDSKNGYSILEDKQIDNDNIISSIGNIFGLFK